MGPQSHRNIKLVEFQPDDDDKDDDDDDDDDAADDDDDDDKPCLSPRPKLCR